MKKKIYLYSLLCLLFAGMAVLPCGAEEPVDDPVEDPTVENPIEEPVEPTVYQPLFGEQMTSYNVFLQIYDYAGTDSIYYVGEQTIEDVVYKAFEHQSWGWGWYWSTERQFIRATEDNAKIYCYHAELEKEVLTFDLTLKVGDTFELYDLGFYSIEPICFTVDSVYIDKRNRKNIRLKYYSDKFYFIEGVGSTISLFLCSLYSLLGFPELLCSKKDDVPSYLYYDDSADEYKDYGPDCHYTYISVEDAASGSLSVSPNPFSGSVCIESPDDELRKLLIYDQSGRRVFREEVEGFNACIEPNLPPGTYALVIETVSGKKYSKKMVKL